PGVHVVVVRTVDGRTEERRINIAKRERQTVAFESLAPAPERPLLGEPRRVAPDRPASGEPRGVSPWLYVSGGVAAAGIAAGTVAGLLAIPNNKVADATCAGAACNPEGKAAADSARTEALISTVGFGVAGAGLATALIVYIALPSRPAMQQPAS